MSLAWNNSVRVGTAVWDCVPLRPFMERLLQRLREKKYGAPERRDGVAGRRGRAGAAALRRRARAAVRTRRARR